MTADAFGNDVTAVGIPVTGFLGFAPAGTTFPTSVEGGSPTFTLPVAFQKAGLLTEDGGFEWTLAADGDPIKFWQEGYTIPSGLANVTLVAKLAQYDAIVRKLAYGKTADANGFITIDGGGHGTEFVAFSEEIFKNGVIRRRIAEVTVKEIAVDKSERGSVNGTQITFSAKRSPLLGNEHIGEWLIAPATELPVVTAAVSTPAAQEAGGTVAITGTGFVGTTEVKFGAASSSLFTVNSPTSITATMPPGAAGSAAITVTNPLGTSAAFAYTRG
ncbi:MAG: IPT/TIG domain-containing protein [Rhodoglobus sp.]